MRDYKSQSHPRWDYKFHTVFTLKKTNFALLIH